MSNIWVSDSATDKCLTQALILCKKDVLVSCTGTDAALHRDGIKFSLTTTIKFSDVFGHSELELIKDFY